MTQIREWLAAGFDKNEFGELCKNHDDLGTEILVHDILVIRHSPKIKRLERELAAKDAEIEKLRELRNTVLAWAFLHPEQGQVTESNIMVRMAQDCISEKEKAQGVELQTKEGEE